MKVKYDPAFEPLRNKHHGYTFIPSGYGNPAMSGQKNDRKRYGLQWLRMQCNQKAVTQWRNMSPATKNAWDLFASTYPQPTKKDPSVFLSGYQLFVKRNTYEFLHEGIDSDFILEPELSVLPDPSFYVQVSDNGMCLNVTEWYLENFGLFPEVGQFVICRILPMAVNSGQFFNPLIATIEIDNVYIDGLFLSLFFSGNAEGLVFSVYLSKPVHAGRAYPSTKFRYMGCFKPTQFIQLTDTPNDYTGQAGKFVAVKDTEDGVEFVDAGGGGIDCDDLADCSLIELMMQQIADNSDIISILLNTSIPPVHYGLLYNFYMAIQTGDDSITSSPDWVVPSSSQMTTFFAFIGANQGYAASEMGSDYWNIANGTNMLDLNLRGAGNRSAGSGAFSQLKNYVKFWTSTPYFSSGGRIYHRLNNTNYFGLPGGFGSNYGLSIRLMNPTTTKADGEVGTYTGNNGRVYRTKVFGTQEFLTDSLCETLTRAKNPIPEVTDNSAWAALTTPALCAYDNDWSYV